MALVTCSTTWFRQSKRLTNLVSSERREDDTGIITRRGIAFRLLANADPESQGRLWNRRRVPSTYKRWTPGSQINRERFPDNLAGTTG